MGILAWILFGALAGWVAGMITGTSHRRGCIGNIIIGIIGAMLGGFLVQWFTGTPVTMAFNLRSFGVAVVGALVLLTIAGAVRSSGKNKKH